MEFDEVIKKRASIRRYSSKKPKIEEVIKCIKTANLAPSAGNLDFLRYIIVEDFKKIEKIADACQQKFIQQAQILVVVCSDRKRANILYEDRADAYIRQGAGAAIENFLLKITEMGLASCWVGAFCGNIVKSELRIPDEIEVEAILPVAYQAKFDKTKQKHKLPIDERLFFETWSNKYQRGLERVRRGDI
jgi:nitroreductase